MTPLKVIIEGGEKNVPFLLKKLKESDNEAIKEEAIYIVSAMFADGQLKNRKDIIAEIEQTISQMKNEEVKTKSKRWLENMKVNVER